MPRFRAAWVLPIASPPIRDGWVTVDRGRIVACGDGVPDDRCETDLGHVAVLPGLVNAHTHLELSYLRGGIAPTDDFVQWIREMVAARGRAPRVDVIQDGVVRAIDEATRCGTVLVGDISNTLASVGPLVDRSFAAVVFHELLGFNAADPRQVVRQAIARMQRLGGDCVRVGLAAHAPYSVSPAVFREIAAALGRGDVAAPCSIHLAESAAESEFIATGGGPWRPLLEDLRAWNPHWMPPGGSSVEYLEALGTFEAPTLVVHAVHVSASDLRRLASRPVTVVTCPRSNRLTGAGTPPIGAFYASGVPVAVGTDSLATVPDLNLFFEIAAVRALAPDVPASMILASATLQGARALGFDTEFGALAPGRRASLLAVRVPSGIDDVEEYLVSGVSPESLSWVADTPRP